MDGPGGCCIARYATGGVVYNAAKFDRIMLGFRPIAPKPASRGSSFGKLSTERKDKCVRRTGRGRKRRSFTSSTSSSDKTKHSVSRKRQRKSSENEIGGDAVESAAVVTLPLLPPELEANEERNIHKNSVGFSIPSTWLRLQTRFVQQQHHQSVQKVVETWVTVESVTDSCMVDACGLGRTDEQKRMALETDSCPGMISDVLGDMDERQVHRDGSWWCGGFRGSGVVRVEGYDVGEVGVHVQCESAVHVWEGDERVGAASL